MTGPRDDPNADWASVFGEFPEDLHGNTRGKRYQFKSDGRCPECVVEAWERQTYGGLGAGLPRSTVLGRPPRWARHAFTTEDDWVQFVQIAR